MQLHRVVVDTNVLISSLWGGNPKKIIDLWKEEKIILCISRPILFEYLEVISRFNPTKAEGRDLLLILTKRRSLEVVNPQQTLSVIKEDPDDNMFLDCAIEARANFIITGDNHLLELKDFRGIKILSPNSFMDLISREPLSNLNFN